MGKNDFQQFLVDISWIQLGKVEGLFPIQGEFLSASLVFQIPIRKQLKKRL